MLGWGFGIYTSRCVSECYVLPFGTLRVVKFATFRNVWGMRWGMRWGFRNVVSFKVSSKIAILWGLDGSKWDISSLFIHLSSRKVKDGLPSH